MQLADYVRILRRRALLIIVAAVFGLVGAFAATSQQAKVYRTDAQFIVSVTQGGPSGDITRRPLAVAEAVALSQLASTPTAVAAAEAAAGGTAGGSVSATADNNSPFSNLTVTGGDPVAIAQIANAYAKVLPQVQRTLRQAEAGTVVTLIADQPAPVPPVAISPRPKQNLAIGLALGLILGLGAALAREALDRRVLDSADLERASGLTRLGSIPKELDDELLPARSHPRSLRAEAYRMVRANVQFTDLAGTTPVLLVTSSNPGDGKTSLATNLAVSCALAGERVIVIDGDLRQPRVGAHFGIDRGPGLCDVLRGRQSFDLALTVMEGLDVLPSGPVPPNPSELLGSPADGRAAGVPGAALRPGHPGRPAGARRRRRRQARQLRDRGPPRPADRGNHGRRADAGQAEPGPVGGPGGRDRGQPGPARAGRGLRLRLVPGLRLRPRAHQAPAPLRSDAGRPARAARPARGRGAARPLGDPPDVRPEGWRPPGVSSRRLTRPWETTPLSTSRRRTCGSTCCTPRSPTCCARPA